MRIKIPHRLSSMALNLSTISSGTTAAKNQMMISKEKPRYFSQKNVTQITFILANNFFFGIKPCL
jgi:hypothetical protein